MSNLKVTNLPHRTGKGRSNGMREEKKTPSLLSIKRTFCTLSLAPMKSSIAPVMGYRFGCIVLVHVSPGCVGYARRVGDMTTLLTSDKVYYARDASAKKAEP